MGLREGVTMLPIVYFSLFVLFVAVVGILINPTSNAARGILIANVLIVTMNIVQLEQKVEKLQDNKSEEIFVS